MKNRKIRWKYHNLKDIHNRKRPNYNSLGVFHILLITHPFPTQSNLMYLWIRFSESHTNILLQTSSRFTRFVFIHEYLGTGIIKVNGKFQHDHIKDEIFEILKNDDFSWVNHPNILETDSIEIITKMERKYIFVIYKTSNQGVLVSRLNIKGNEFIINRNTKILNQINNAK